MPDVPPAVFFRLLALCLDERSDRELKSQGGGKGASSDVGRTRFDLVVRHTVQESVHPKAGRLLASGSAGADPSCPKTDVPQEPRDAASPASTASPPPANVTIAIAPLGGAGRRGNINLMGMLSTGDRKKCLTLSCRPTLVIPGRGRRLPTHANPTGESRA